MDKEYARTNPFAVGDIIEAKANFDDGWAAGTYILIVRGRGPAARLFESTVRRVNDEWYR